MSDERPALRVRGEDVTVGDRRINVRETLSAALGVELDDQALAEILHGLRASLVPKDDVQRTMDEGSAWLLRLRQLLEQAGRPS